MTYTLLSIELNVGVLPDDSWIVEQDFKANIYKTENFNLLFSVMSNPTVCWVFFFASTGDKPHLCIFLTERVSPVFQENYNGLCSNVTLECVALSAKNLTDLLSITKYLNPDYILNGLDMIYL